MSKAIVIQPKGEGFSIIIPGEAIRLKEQALLKAGTVKAVTNADEQEAAITAAAVVKGLVSGMEKTHKEVKKPYWDAGKAIDARKAEYNKELEAEAARLERLISSFQQAEQRKREEAERAAAEAKRLADEAVAAEAKRLADLEKQEQAAIAEAAEAKTRKAKSIAAAKVARLQDERFQAEIDAMEAQDEQAVASATVIMPDAPAATGAAVSFLREFEVADIDAFYAWDLARRQAVANRVGRPVAEIPSWLRMEIKRTEVKILVDSLQETELDSIPGLAIRKTAKTAVRGVSPAVASALSFDALPEV